MLAILENTFSSVVFESSPRLSFMQNEIVKTGRYVYHMTHKMNRKSIKKKGIIASSCDDIGYSNTVFAHNSTIPSLYWYPFVNSRFEYVGIPENPECYFDFESVGSYRDFEFMSVLYDVWEIDTLTLDNEWFLDNPALRDFGGDVFGGRELYVFTFGNIPADCIRLVKLNAKWKRMDLNGVSITTIFYDMV
jgi:hypothetical protein